MSGTIDQGRAFDWGRTSPDYAKYRDIYPQAFYQRLIDMGLCVNGQSVLDIGTGTGVLPRNLYRYGAAFTAVDRSKNQIAYAERLAEEAGMKIRFRCEPAETCRAGDERFDVVTACQCFMYFDHERLAPHISGLLKAEGKFAVLYMAWLPKEDRIAAGSEALILEYNPAWTGCGEERHTIRIPEVYGKYFCLESEEVFDLSVPFTRESWNGRIRSCRGVGASLPAEALARFDAEHSAMLQEAAPPEFHVAHYAAISVLRKKPGIR